jgi:hypothetical protein
MQERDGDPTLLLNIQGTKGMALLLFIKLVYIMTLQEFKKLTKQRQYRVIVHTGVFLGERTLPGMKAQLFQVDSFYLEALYRMPGEEMAFMRVFEDTDALQPYLQSIDLHELFPYMNS